MQGALDLPDKERNMKRVGIPRGGFIYDKLIEVAKLESYWKKPEMIYKYFLENKIITSSANPNDSVNTIRRQIMVLGELKHIFNKNRQKSVILPVEH